MASRQVYSKADDDAMWRYLHQQVLLGNEDAYAPMGVKIWKTASESGVTNKSVHSMTCHFRRKLLPAIHKSPLSRNDVVFLLNKWSLADAISLRNINEDVTIEQYEDSISSADDVIVQ
uniref:Uncharacterized protein n=1 Tax=Plectus sambesii TaxID=2011161 RepID=A0A914X439_9BILA